MGSSPFTPYRSRPTRFRPLTRPDAPGARGASNERLGTGSHVSVPTPPALRRAARVRRSCLSRSSDHTRGPGRRSRGPDLVLQGSPARPPARARSCRTESSTHSPTRASGLVGENVGRQSLLGREPSRDLALPVRMPGEETSAGSDGALWRCTGQTRRETEERGDNFAEGRGSDSRRPRRVDPLRERSGVGCPHRSVCRRHMYRTKGV